MGPSIITSVQFNFTCKPVLLTIVACTKRCAFDIKFYLNSSFKLAFSCLRLVGSFAGFIILLGVSMKVSLALVGYKLLDEHIEMIINQRFNCI